MDILDTGLDSSQDKDDDNPVHLVVEAIEDTGDDEENATLAGVTQGLTIDPSLHYQIKTDTSQGAVTYRVVQVPDSLDASNLSSASGFSAASLPTLFNNNGTADLTSGDPKITYVGSLGNNDGIATQSNELSGAVANLSNNGQLYVMMSPQDVLQGQRTIAPRTHNLPRMEGGRGSRDEKRRATHNEVERRRRDKINNWIVQLSKLIPECSDIKQVGMSKSKGGILAKACDYITGLRSTISRLQEQKHDLQLIQQQNDELRQENLTLQRILKQNGIEVPLTQT